MTYLEYKRRMEFGKREYDYIDRYCAEKPISWALSVWDTDSLRFACQYKLAFLKIPSAHLTDHELLEECCRTKLPVILSTGMSTLSQIDEAVRILQKKASQFVLMHCNSSYPAKLEELNLAVRAGAVEIQRPVRRVLHERQERVDGRLTSASVRAQGIATYLSPAASTAAFSCSMAAPSSWPSGN